MNIACIRHPKYDGKTSPVLSCKTCCVMFVSEIRSKSSSDKIFDASSWLDKKVKEVCKYNSRKYGEPL